MVHRDEGSATDLELMSTFCKGHEDAFAALVRRHQHSLVNLFRRLGADHHGAEDCAQDTFLRLYRYRDRYRPTGPFRSFLYTLARHAWVDWTRRRKRRWQDESAASEAAAADARTAFEERLDLREALRRLPEHLRSVLLLSTTRGLNYPDIAQVLGIPVGTVKSRVFHAVRRLREALHARVEE